jgi:glucoamylase
VQRYVIEKATSSRVSWRFNNKVRAIPAGSILRIEIRAPALVHWSPDNWQTVADVATGDTKLGIHVADLPTANLPVGTRLVFTFYWPEIDRWERVDFAVMIE